MELPKISVIVPIYNTEKYLEKCLLSLLNQTYENIEIVAIDDGSTDSSADIVKGLKERYPDKIKYIYQKNSGQGAARNVGIDMCTGEYIGFMDSDDYADEHMFEKMYKKADEKKADYTACGYSEFYEKDGEEIIIKPYVASRVCKTPEDLFFDVWVSPWLHLYKSSVIKNSGVRFPEGVIYEDTAFFINLIPYIKTTACIEEPLVHHRKHKSSTMTAASFDKVMNILPVIDDIQRKYKKDSLNKAFGTEKEYVCVRILLCSSVERISKIKRRAERKSAVKKTLDYIAREFPNYRRNPNFGKGKRNFYIRNASPLLVGSVCEIMRIKNKFGSKYQ